MEPQSSHLRNSSENRKTLTYRVRGIPLSVDITSLHKSLEVLLESQDLHVDSLVPSSIRRQGQVATIRFTTSAKLPGTHDEWRIPTGRTLIAESNGKRERILVIDTHFQGFTPLYSPASNTEHSLDCIAISGLGSHAFGSWKDRNSHYMWLRDTLPHDLPGARVLTYGYDTRLAESNSFQNLEDVALTFRASLRVALGSRPPDRPLVFIAHSLGGLVLKQAIIQMASGDSIDRHTFQSTYGILFFGVPNQGMDISSLLTMVGSQPNLPFLTMLSKNSGILQGLVEKFRTVFNFKDSEIVSLYETYASRTAKKDTLGKWTMSGDYAILVDRFSARSGRQWEESHPFLYPINGNHSDMVKFSEYDDVGANVVNFLIGFARTAPAVIRDRVKSLESSASDPSDGKQLTFRSQSLKREAETEELEKPIEAKLRTVKLREGTELSSKEKEGPNDRHQEGRIEVETKKSKRSSSSGTSIRKPDTDLEMFAKASFRIEIPTSRDQGLVWAARKGHVSLVQHLLNRQASIKYQDEYGWNLLHWAVFTANLNLFHLLSSKGADYRAKTELGDSMLHLVSSFGVGHVRREDGDHIGSSSDRKAIGLELLDLGLTVDIFNAKQETPLAHAARYGLEDMVLVLISKGADLTLRDGICGTPLMRAAENGHMGVVKMLIERQNEVTHFGPGWCLAQTASRGKISAVKTLLDAGVMIDAVGDHYDTALMNAARNGYDNIVQLLLDKGANIDAIDDHYDTALINAASNGHDNIIQLLLDKGANIDITDFTGDTALMYAARSGHDNIIQLLLDNGANVDITDFIGDTALIYAARNGHDNIVQLLLDKGANVDITDFTGDTALMNAARNGYDNIVQLLLDKGANIDAVNDHHGTALMCAAMNGYNKIVQLLLDNGANVDITGFIGDTALIYAARYGYDNIVQLLLDKGANIEAKNKNGQTAIIQVLNFTSSSQDSQADTVQLLIDRGANVGAPSANGWSALHGSVWSENLRAVDLLLRAGANPLAENYEKESPLDLALRRGFNEVAERLKLELLRKERYGQ